MIYRILAEPGDAGHEAVSASAAVAAYTERQAARAAAAKVVKDREAAIAAQLAVIAVENKARDERAAKAKQAREEKAFDDGLRFAFFEANPMASELDWLKGKAAFKAAALQSRALDQLKGRETLVEINKEILLRGRAGSYGL